MKRWAILASMALAMLILVLRLRGMRLRSGEIAIRRLGPVEVVLGVLEKESSEK
jgi:hypothetical protein